MKVATAAYPLDPLASWQAFAEKLESWVAEAAGQGAELLLFPEYGALELAHLDGSDVAADCEGSMEAVSRLMPDVDTLHSELAAKYGVHICGASATVYDPDVHARPVNRARLFTPTGGVGIQDKQLMTLYERTPMEVVGGGPLRLFDTKLGRIGILICYDSEFPLLGRAFHDIDILLVPSCTETLAGYWRVRIGAMARALETQCVSVMSSIVGEAPWMPHADSCVGAGGVFGPPDKGFPPTGVFAEGTLNAPGWTYADVDIDAIAEVRRNGNVRNRTHWAEQDGRADKVTPQSLS